MKESPSLPANATKAGAAADQARHFQDKRESASPWLSFGLCSLAMFLVMLDATILFVAFQAIRASFGPVAIAELLCLAHCSFQPDD